jgi:hypothetical protein
MKIAEYLVANAHKYKTEKDLVVRCAMDLLVNLTAVMNKTRELRNAGKLPGNLQYQHKEPRGR